MRTSEQIVTFRHPFKLRAIPSMQPAGRYKLVIDEEEMLGLSFVAYRRAATMLHTPTVSSSDPRREVYLIDADDLELAMKADRHESAAG